MLLEYPTVQPGPTQQRITWHELLLAQMAKNLLRSAGDLYLVPGLKKILEKENGNLLSDFAWETG